jgi:hypothetical protein
MNNNFLDFNIQLFANKNSVELNPDLQIGETGTKLSELIDRVTTLENQTVNPYPVGAIYMSVNSTSPDSLFGGT